MAGNTHFSSFHHSSDRMNVPSTHCFSRLIADSGNVLGSRLEAELLLAHLLGRDRVWLYAHGDESCPSAIEVQLHELVDRRKAGEPIAYLIGYREFYGREFRLTADVLIPRPETELLIEQALSLNLSNQAEVLDIGTGSGCIGITLSLERPQWQVTATDLSAEALAVAESNRIRLKADGLQLLHGSLLRPLKGRRFDLIVSNPPYVAANDPHLEQGDLRFEPRIALSAQNNGLQLIDKIIRQSPEHLHAGGWLILEHGFDQAELVRASLSQAGFSQVQSRRDLAGIERISFGTKR